MKRKTNFDKYLEEQLRDPKFAERFQEAGEDWDVALQKRAVKRNIDRFPKDFMFELAKNELESWRCQFGTSKGEIKGLRYKPLAAPLGHFPDHQLTPAKVMRLMSFSLP